MSVTLQVSEARSRDVGRGIARVDPDVIASLGMQLGDVVLVNGKKTSPARLMPTFADVRGQGKVQLDGLLRQNSGAKLGDTITLRAAEAAPAAQVTLRAVQPVAGSREENHVAKLLDGLPVQAGDQVRATLFGSRWVDFQVVSTRPKGVVVVHPTTALRIDRPKQASKRGRTAEGGSPGLTYEDIGGLGEELGRIREMIELPLRTPEVFHHLGISPPKGVLMHGPPGTGKTLIARALANETNSTFYAVNGPEIIHKFYGESEAHLRKIFEQAAASPPAIIFLDELDAIAPRRDKSVGDVEKRVVAQLLALMDGLSKRGQVIVIGATNIPDALDPALRRPGRFDRELEISVPDRHGRLEVLEIHTRGMPLGEDVDLKHLSEVTHGFVGADLQGLCREAAMICLRSALPDLDHGAISLTAVQQQELVVSMPHFLAALQRVEPSAVRCPTSASPTSAGWRTRSRP